jgi:hypothetical protein
MEDDRLAERRILAEHRRGELAAYVAVDAARVDELIAGDVFGKSVCGTGHEALTPG